VRVKYGEAPISLTAVESATEEIVAHGDVFVTTLATSAGSLSVHFLVKDADSKVAKHPVTIVGCPSPASVLPHKFYGELEQVKAGPSTCEAPAAALAASEGHLHHPMYFDADAPFTRGLGLLEDPLLQGATASTLNEEDRASVAASLPASFDSDARWPGCKHPIMDQGSCGSCYAFAILTAFRTRQCIAKAKLGQADAITTSNILSSMSPTNCGRTDKCETNVGGADGCAGGGMSNMASFLVQMGVRTEQQLPYTAGGGSGGYADHFSRRRSGGGIETSAGHGTATCTESVATAHVKAKGWYSVNGVEETRTALLLHGPLTITFDTYPSFMDSSSSSWKDGLYQGRLAGEAKSGAHAVTLVGWGSTAAGVEYWKILNSWGSSWCDGGYAKMAIAPVSGFETYNLPSYTNNNKQLVGSLATDHLLKKHDDGAVGDCLKVTDCKVSLSTCAAGEARAAKLIIPTTKTSPGGCGGYSYYNWATFVEGEKLPASACTGRFLWDDMGFKITAAVTEEAMHWANPQAGEYAPPPTTTTTTTTTTPPTTTTTTTTTTTAFGDTRRRRFADARRRFADARRRRFSDSRRRWINLRRRFSDARRRFSDSRRRWTIRRRFSDARRRFSDARRRWLRRRFSDARRRFSDSRRRRRRFSDSRRRRRGRWWLALDEEKEEGASTTLEDQKNLSE
jgi:C1A family cysteine protease